MRDKTPPSSYWESDTYFVLDQLLLPEKTFYIQCRNPLDVAKAITDMNLRGAPLIGAAASAGAALFFRENNNSESSFYEILEMLQNTRPTAVNLKNVLDEVKILYEKNNHGNQTELFTVFRDFSLIVHKRDIERNLQMGEKGAEYLSGIFNGKKINVLTHCNAGALATCGYGTALGVIRSLHKRGLINQVWVDETRPYLQGSRITAYEMGSESIPHKIITDSTAAWLMSKKLVDVVITGADRVAANGDLANKIGTYSLAVNANFHNIPFVSVMPVETFDMNITDGSRIVIEERSDTELLFFNGKRIAPDSSSGLHLGFDVVPAFLTSAVITEKGIVAPVSQEGVREMING